ncbi:MAG: hypothetical protein KC503_08955 [Myxococcales bacterium]|nr:hypothetical protein [Myxococcales bacterium]
MKLWTKILIGVLIAGGTVSYLIYTLMAAQSWRCEVCIVYKGHRSCKAARAETRLAAYSTAAHLACSLITSGVTERMACPNTPPASKTCSKQ